MPKKTQKAVSEAAHEEQELIGAGGELHQTAGGTHPPMTTQTGAVVADDVRQLNRHGWLSRVSRVVVLAAVRDFRRLHGGRHGAVSARRE